MKLLEEEVISWEWCESFSNSYAEQKSTKAEEQIELLEYFKNLC